jgi:excisionase family DNA binding protein
MLPNPEHVAAHRQDDRRLLTIADVCEKLQVSTPTVRRWIKSGALMSRRLGRQIRIRPCDLEAFVDAGATPTTPDYLSFLK